MNGFDMISKLTLFPPLKCTSFPCGLICCLTAHFKCQDRFDYRIRLAEPNATSFMDPFDTDI